ncbi:MAG: phosphatase PAP2 family protein [Myxococcota bacterium]|nr:phosphatase PAP2 family protein [Myxococcota bacterium]
MSWGRSQGGVIALMIFLACALTPASLRAQELLLPEWKPESAPEDSKSKKMATEVAEFSYSLANDTLSDTWSIAKSPLKWRWKGWLTAAFVAGGTVGLVYGVDQRVSDASQDDPGFREFGEDIRWLGNGPGLAALTGGFALAGWMFDRPKELQTARLLIEASLSGVVFTTAGKYLMGRSRPRKDLGPRDFDPFSGNMSMPSGETTSAFIMAGVITSQYPQWYVQLISYSLAGAVGAGRIALDAHWTSDVFISAALGIAVSKAVVYFNRKRQEKRKKLKAAGSSRRVYRKHYFAVSPRSFRWTIVF